MTVTDSLTYTGRQSLYCRLVLYSLHPIRLHTCEVSGEGREGEKCSPSHQVTSSGGQVVIVTTQVQGARSQELGGRKEADPHARRGCRSGEHLEVCTWAARRPEQGGSCRLLRRSSCTPPPAFQGARAVSTAGVTPWNIPSYNIRLKQSSHIRRMITGLYI